MGHHADVRYDADATGAYRIAFENAAIGMAVLDGSRGRIVQLNRAFARILGRSAESLLGKPWTAVSSPENIKRGLEHMRALARGDVESTSYDTAYLTGDDQPIWLRVSLAPIRDTQGNIRRVLAHVEEITARVRAERALAESEAQFRLAFDSAVIGMMVIGADGRFTNVNQSFASMIGRTVAELHGTRWESVIHPGDAAQTAAIMERLWRGEAATISGDARYRRSDGTTGWCRAAAWLQPDHRGAPQSIVSHVEDTTAKRRAQQALVEARDRAEEANRLKTEFLRNVSHEIRTPMSSILGMVEITLNTSLDPDQREYLDIARSSAEHLLAIVNQILDLAKIEAGRLEPAAVEMSPAEVVAEALRPLAAQAERSGLKLFAEIDPAVPARLVGDRLWLGQIVANLVGNAIKFTDSGEVQVRLQPVSDEPGESTLLLSVADTGIGVPAGLCEQIFAPFIQADGSTTRRHGGTGLGLAITERMVSALGGSIALSSEVGIGSEFVVTLPFRPHPAAAPALRKDPGSRAVQGSLLTPR